MEPPRLSAPRPSSEVLRAWMRGPWFSDAVSAGVSGVLVVVFLVLFAAVLPALRSPAAILSVVVGWCVYGLLALALTVVMAAGRVDLSGVAVATLAGAVAAKLAVVGVPLLVGFVPGALLGLLIGVANGLGASISRQAAFVVTLATAAVCGAGAMGVLGAGGAVVPHGPEGLLPLVVPAVLLAVAAGALTLIGLASPAGVLLRRLGVERDAAPPRFTVPAYACAALLAAGAGAVQVAHAGAARPEVSAPAQLAVIAAALLGGSSLRGGRGRGYGAVVAALAVALLFSGLTGASVPEVPASVAIGLLVVGAVAWDEARSRLSPAG